jgi:FdhD protein
MDFKQLEFLVALDETRHFSQAAARRHVSQPTLSMRLRSLDRYATLNTTDPAEPHDARAALLAEECALAISYNGLNHAVMMVTPQDLESSSSASVSLAG